jgi:NOL1/NOP2/fmu family ribosome biogenesis protein
MRERFGAELDGEFYYRGDYWYCRRPEERYETNGVRAVRDMDIGLKPTTYFLQLIEEEIEKSRINLTEKEFRDLLKGRMIEREGLEKGYVALFYLDRYFGCGLFKDDLVSSRIPEGRAEELLDMF